MNAVSSALNGDSSDDDDDDEEEKEEAAAMEEPHELTEQEKMELEGWTYVKRNKRN